MKGVVLAGGKATRLAPLSRVINKHLFPVNGLPMIYYPICTLRDGGIKDILIVVGGNSVGDVVNLLGDGSDLEVNITYRHQSEGALGISHALNKARDYVSGSTFALILGDNVFPDFRLTHYEPRLFLAESSEPEKFGVAVTSGDMVIDIVEKPSTYISNDVVTGLYIYPEHVFELIDTLKPSHRGELEITDLNKALCPMEYSTVGSWFDVGEYESLYAAEQYLRSK